MRFIENNKFFGFTMILMAFLFALILTASFHKPYIDELVLYTGAAFFGVLIILSVLSACKIEVEDGIKKLEEMK